MANRSRNREERGGPRSSGPSGSYGHRSGFSSWDRDRNDDDEAYFGSGRMSYGQGYAPGSYTPRDDEFESYPRAGEGGYDNSRYSRRPSSFGSGSTGDPYSRDQYSQRSGSFGSPSGTFGRNNRYDRYDRPDRSSGWSTSRINGPDYHDYPTSEYGYRTDRESYEDRGWLDRTADEVASWFGDEEAARRREFDHQREGQFRGRGPKGYTRSDERIKEDINDRLTEFSYVDASDIDVEVNGREVVLTGHVNSRYEKRLAEDIAEGVSGVSNVENRLRVQQQDRWAGESDTTANTDASLTETPRSRSAASR